MNFLDRMKSRQARKARRAKVKADNMSRTTDTPSKRVDIADAGTLPEMKVTARATKYKDVRNAFGMIRKNKPTAMQYARSRYRLNQQRLNQKNK